MLSVQKVSKAYGELPVVRNLSLEVDRGEIVALIGPSGCGKSTLLNMISGLIQPDSGRIEKGDVKLSYMFQKARLLPWRTVYQNIALVRENASKDETERLIQAVGLGGFENYYPGQLSGGMAKRCALARAFHYQGDVLLMDEPFQGLDYGIRMEMLSMLISIWKQKKQGILFVTHEIDEALTAATKIAVLKARPTAVQEVLCLPGQVGRDAASPELAKIRGHIIHEMMQEPQA
ncbi:MAG: ABC transporter ATP-binding protein [Eubacteriales bacterium]|nr:ABC transporter ATP-binding protein [Eubacteriales bacterium]